MDGTVGMLVDTVRACRWEALSAQTVAACKQRMIDAVACAASAGDAPESRRIVDFAAPFAHPLAARIWGTGQRCAVDMAAFANGAMIRFLDYNDTFFGRSPGHPSDMIGGLIGLAEALERDGRDLIVATVAAYEVYCGLCDATDFDVRGHDQALAAALGAAVGAALLLEQSDQTLAQAIALAVAPNLHLFNVRCGALTDWKGLAGPNGVRNGIFAALLADRGVAGPSGVFEGQAGLQDLVGPLRWSFRGPGEPYLLRTSIKLHPACYYVQGALDAVIELRGETAPDAIDEILVETYDAAFRATGSDPSRWAPETRETADHSLPFTVGTTLRDGRLSPSSYDAAALADPGLRALMAKVRVVSSPEFTRRFPEELAARVILRRGDGTERATTRILPRGHHRDPVGDAELADKFLRNFAPWGGAAQAERALALLSALERQPSLAAVVDSLCAAN